MFRKKIVFGIFIILFIGCGAKKIENIKVSENYSQDFKYEQIEIKPSADDKIFIREYTYRSSEDDSKNSSRRKAITQLKTLLSEEVGTHIESYLEIQKQSRNGVAYKSINQEIKSLSSAITKLKILDEKWDGRKYWIKASVRINEKRTMEMLLTAIKSKANEKDIKRLNRILAEQKRELENKNYQVSRINKKLVAQEIMNEARKNEVLKMKKQLIHFQKEEIEAKKEEKRYSSELDKLRAKVRKVKSRVQKESKKACLMEKGMTKRDVVGMIGKPSGVNGTSCSGSYGSIYNKYCNDWYYGKINLDFGGNGILYDKSGCR